MRSIRYSLRILLQQLGQNDMKQARIQRGDSWHLSAPGICLKKMVLASFFKLSKTTVY